MLILEIQNLVIDKLLDLVVVEELLKIVSFDISDLQRSALLLWCTQKRLGLHWFHHWLLPLNKAKAFLIEVQLHQAQITAESILGHLKNNLNYLKTEDFFHQQQTCRYFLCLRSLLEDIPDCRMITLSAS